MVDGEWMREIENSKYFNIIYLQQQTNQPFVDKKGMSSNSFSESESDLIDNRTDGKLHLKWLHSSYEWLVSALAFLAGLIPSFIQ